MATAYTLIEVVQFCSLYLFLGILLFFTFNWFNLKEKQIELVKATNAAQLDAMKSQINPHFLFNSLNNIYGLVSTDHEKAKPYVLKLSDSLRYMLYETDEQKVPLENEVQYIQNYVELEQLRFEDDAQIQLTVDLAETHYLISPLLIITLVENCFKHSDKEQTTITITLTQRATDLEISTSNRFQKGINNTSGGKGIQNLKKRLDLEYPNKHKFSTHINDDIYSTHLILDLS